ncbi:MAG: hypothetical protein PVF56_06690 [Desulfobacterales bacterium]|jgi:hypothetical protein
MSDFKLRAKRYHNAIKMILLKEWDPIGVSDIPEANDEYDSYVSGVYKRLISRSTQKELYDFLWEVETQHMGLIGNRSHTEAIAKKLIKLVDIIESGKNT